MRRVAVITGATSGIGLVGACEIANAGFDLFLPCRNLDKGESARQVIQAAAAESEVVLIHCEMSSLESVRQCGEAINSAVDHVELLINNAGLVNFSLQFSEDGIERTFAVNHLSHFLLTHLLMDKLKAADSARIVHTASEANYDGSAEFLSDINYENRRYRFFKCYGDSKLSNILFNNKLASDCAKYGIVSNSFHPGRVATGIWPNSRWYEKLVFAPLMKLYLISPEQGAKPMLHLALSDEMATRSGEFWFESKPKAPHRDALDEAAQEWLWALSLELTSEYR